MVLRLTFSGCHNNIVLSDGLRLVELLQVKIKFRFKYYFLT